MSGRIVTFDGIEVKCVSCLVSDRHIKCDICTNQWPCKNIRLSNIQRKCYGSKCRAKCHGDKNESNFIWLKYTKLFGKRDYNELNWDWNDMAFKRQFSKIFQIRFFKLSNCMKYISHDFVDIQHVKDAITDEFFFCIFILFVLLDKI